MLFRMGKATTEGTDMVRRGVITDRAWQEIEPLLPEYGQSGCQMRDHQQVVNGILWKLRPGPLSCSQGEPHSTLGTEHHNR
jgi:hypothetical protein